jgi:predicted AlkP superfamily phosphohydrolase/phosphomutase
MELQDTFAQQLQAQIKDWDKQAKEFKAKAEKSETQVRAEYEKNLKNLQKTMDQAGKMLSQVQQVNEAAWKDMEASTARAFEELKKGWEDAAARYK